MFCNKCGNELISGAKFCNKCGQKVEAGDDNLSEFAPAENLPKTTKDIEQKENINSKLIKMIKQRKYFALGGLGIVLFMVVLISLLNQKGKVGDSEPSKIETASLIATSSSIISSETDLDLSESSLSSANNSETSDSASAALEDKEDEDTYDSDISSGLSDEGEAEDSGARLIGSDEGISYEDEEEEMVEEPVETYQNSIIEVYKGRGNDKTKYAYNQNLIRSFEDKLAEITGAEDDGSLGMRYEIIELLGKNHDYLFDYYYDRYWPTEKDVSPFVNSVRSYLGGWGVDTAPTTVYKDNLRQEYNGYTYDFSGTDTWDNSIKVHTYFELISNDTRISRIVVWTEDADNVEK